MHELLAVRAYGLAQPGRGGQVRRPGGGGGGPLGVGAFPVELVAQAWLRSRRARRVYRQRQLKQRIPAVFKLVIRQRFNAYIKRERGFSYVLIKTGRSKERNCFCCLVARKWNGRIGFISIFN